MPDKEYDERGIEKPKRSFFKKVSDRVVGSPEQRKERQEQNTRLREHIQKARREGYVRGRLHEERRRAIIAGRRAATPMPERIAGAIVGFAGTMQPPQRPRPRQRKQKRRRRESPFVWF